jgi:hypothetical protein
MSHQHQSLLDRRPRAAQRAVVLYELCGVLSACQHPYGLLVFEDDSSLTPVSEHGDFLAGIAAAGHAVEVEDFDFAYALYAGDPSNGSSMRVASFREGRIGYRLWDTRSGRINPSVEDRYDHDIDELTA